MIYFVRAKGTELVKIGFTESGCKKRLRGLSTGSPMELLLEAEIDGCEIKERFLHSQCIGNHEHGEWFRLSPEAVIDLVNRFRNWNPRENGVEWMPTIKGAISRLFVSSVVYEQMAAEEYAAIREKLGLTQAGLADLLGVSLRTVKYRENGRLITQEAMLAIQWLAEG